MSNSTTTYDVTAPSSCGAQQQSVAVRTRRKGVVQVDWENIQAQWKQDALATDKEDLMGLLELRFGALPEGVPDVIASIADGNVLERLILVAANVPTWDAFASELMQRDAAFRIVGNQYQPF